MAAERPEVDRFGAGEAAVDACRGPRAASRPGGRGRPASAPGRARSAPARWRRRAARRPADRRRRAPAAGRGRRGARGARLARRRPSAAGRRRGSARRLARGRIGRVACAQQQGQQADTAGIDHRSASLSCRTRAQRAPFGTGRHRRERQLQLLGRQRGVPANELGGQLAPVGRGRCRAPEVKRDQHDQRPALAQRRALAGEHDASAAATGRASSPTQPRAVGERASGAGRATGGGRGRRRRGQSSSSATTSSSTASQIRPPTRRRRRDRRARRRAPLAPERAVRRRVDGRRRSRRSAAPRPSPQVSVRAERPVARALGAASSPRPRPDAVAGERERRRRRTPRARRRRDRAPCALTPYGPISTTASSVATSVCSPSTTASARGARGQPRRDPERAAAVGAPQQICSVATATAPPAAATAIASRPGSATRVHVAAAPAIEAGRRRDPDVVGRRRRGQRVRDDRRRPATGRARRRGASPSSSRTSSASAVSRSSSGSPARRKRLLGVDGAVAAGAAGRVGRRRREARAARDLAPGGVERHDRVRRAARTAAFAPAARPVIRVGGRRGARARGAASDAARGGDQRRHRCGRTTCARISATAVPRDRARACALRVLAAGRRAAACRTRAPEIVRRV